VTSRYNLGDEIDRAGNRDDVALIDLGGENPSRSYSFRDLDDMSDSVALGLLARGLKNSDRVAIVSANRVEYLATFLGAMKAGLVPVPVNIKLQSEGVEYIVSNSDAKIVFSDAERVSLCPGSIPLTVFGERGENGFESFLRPGPFAAVRPLPRQPAMMLYTSGSTGKPKGVLLSHESHLWVLDMRRRPPETERQRVLVAAPLYHMNALSTSQSALAQHDSIVLMPSFSTESYAQAIERYNCTLLSSVPTMIAMMLQRKDLVRRTDLSSVKAIRMGSAPVSPALFELIRNVFPTAEISNVYGTTESSPVTFASHPEGIAQPLLSLGYGHPYVHLRLAGVEDGVSGEGVLEIKSPGLMNGYHKMSEATRRAMTADGYYMSGDVFRRDADGFYFFLGRTDDMFNCGGENIYPSEIETLLERHPAVQQACVVPIPDDIKGQKPVAFVVLKTSTIATEQEIKDFALVNGPAYQHPRRIWFVANLPLATTNKIDTKELTKLAFEYLLIEQAGMETIVETGEAT
jgi:acyl-CoA synthetase (AMP-forming)/AMP-acid ligase II